MNVLLTLNDFPPDKRNCGNCTRQGGACHRSGKSFPNGYVINELTRDIGGIIYCCPHYTGRYENKQVDLWMSIR